MSYKSFLLHFSCTYFVKLFPSAKFGFYCARGTDRCVVAMSSSSSLSPCCIPSILKVTHIHPPFLALQLPSPTTLSNHRPLHPSSKLPCTSRHSCPHPPKITPHPTPPNYLPSPLAPLPRPAGEWKKKTAGGPVHTLRDRALVAQDASSSRNNAIKNVSNTPQTRLHTCKKNTPHIHM
jgi:hypothetical protein